MTALMSHPQQRNQTGRRTGIAFVLALTTLLAGCISIPTSGPVQEGERIDSGTTDQVIRVIARPPQPGMGPGEIVAGFVQASASFEDDHAVAREYLTPESAAVWSPGTGTQVYDGTLTLSAQSGTAESSVTTVGLSAPEVGTISDQGRYQVSAASREVNITFRLTTVNGQWRIASTPVGLLLSRADIDRAYRTYNVYFLDPTFTTLVPDPRMIALDGPGVATSLTRALVAGPTDWLAPAVRTGFPDGSALAVDAVPIVDGVARVDLDTLARLTDDATRAAMSAQLVWTLRQISAVQAVDITAGGQPWTVAGAGSPQSRDAWPSFDPNLMPPDTVAYLVSGTRVARLLDNGPVSVPGGAGLGEPPLSGIAITLDGAQVAGLGDRANVWLGPMVQGEVLVEAIAEPGQSRPSFGRGPLAWSVSSEGVVQQISPDGVTTDVPVEGLPDRVVIESVSMSRDGTRVALVTRRGPRAILFIAIVVQRESGPILTSPVRAESRLSELIDVSWSRDDQLISIAAEGAAPQTLYEIDLGRGTVRDLGAPESPIRVAAAPGQQTLIATADGRIFAPLAGAWSLEAMGSSPAYPGG
jgi:hypothetical protein